MLKTLLSPRLLGLHLLTIGVVIAFIMLGRWQLGVFEDSGRPMMTTDPAPVPVTELAPSARRCRAPPSPARSPSKASTKPSRQLLVADRRPDVDAPGGKVSRDHGYWVLTPIRLDDGTLMPVVRGWVADAADPAATAVPAGRMSVPGRLRPQQGSDTVQRRQEGLPPRPGADGGDRRAGQPVAGRAGAQRLRRGRAALRRAHPGRLAAADGRWRSHLAQPRLRRQLVDLRGVRRVHVVPLRTRRRTSGSGP
ncbi:SURF1 family cytochrome oxidase biogenesis protein [Nonomuraea ferruginea]